MTGDPLYDLIAACLRQAVRDARRGRADAIYFLDDTLPEWRKYTSPSKPEITEEISPFPSQSYKTKPGLDPA